MSKASSPYLSIIIPAYKEAKTIGQTLETLARYIHRPGFPATEVIVSVGASPDATLAEAAAKKSLFDFFTVLDNGTPPYKGRNVKLGMLEAKGEVCVYMDADLSTPLTHLETMLDLLKHHDVVVAERAVQASHHGHRKFISVVGNLITRVVLLPGFKDTQCGFKGFRRATAQRIFAQQRISNWAFDMEILALARKMGVNIERFHVGDWAEVNKGGQLDRGAVKAFMTSLSTLIDLLRVRWYLLIRAYDVTKPKQENRSWSE